MPPGQFPRRSNLFYVRCGWEKCTKRDQVRVGSGTSEVRGVGCHGLTWRPVGLAITCRRPASIACRESCRSTCHGAAVGCHEMSQGTCYGYSHTARAVAAPWVITARGTCRDNPRVAMAAHDKLHGSALLATGCHDHCRSHAMPLKSQTRCIRGVVCQKTKNNQSNVLLRRTVPETCRCRRVEANHQGERSTGVTIQHTMAI